VPDGNNDLDVATLSRQYGPMVLRRCRQLLRNEDEALDACQDVFVRLFERRRRLDARYPSSLLYRMATNVCLNRIRDRGRRPVVDSDNPAGGGGPDDEVDRLHAIACAETPGAWTEARMLLDWLFNRHPESSRTIAVLHYVDGLTGLANFEVTETRRRIIAIEQDPTVDHTNSFVPDIDADIGRRSVGKAKQASDRVGGELHAVRLRIQRRMSPRSVEPLRETLGLFGPHGQTPSCVVT
jgi:RNA polymerase sigma-70 factor (ECF subfamily)